MSKPARDPRLGRLHVLAWQKNGVSPTGRCDPPCRLAIMSDACSTCGKGSGDKWRKSRFDAGWEGVFTMKTKA